MANRFANDALSTPQTRHPRAIRPRLHPQRKNGVGDRFHLPTSEKKRCRGPFSSPIIRNFYAKISDIGLRKACLIGRFSMTEIQFYLTISQNYFYQFNVIKTVPDTVFVSLQE
jgi:hypothetical protein